MERLNCLLEYFKTYRFPAGRGGVFEEISQITNNIFISNFDKACEVDKLNQLDIKYVLYIGEPKKSKECIKEYENSNISYIQFDGLSDSNVTDISSIFDECKDIIWHNVSNNLKILVHCREGISRSVTIVIYYFLWRFYKLNKIDDNSLFQIIKFIQSKRPCIEPNPNFLQQLIKASDKFNSKII